MKRVEMAEFAEKNAKRTSYQQTSQRIEAITMHLKWTHYNFVYANPKREEFSIFHSVFECF